uniref:Uncharacterized protein n=1 Tax=Odontella aurita TaxID=265563 RepID=A0A7S4K4R5_9STRA|mmetsp:Transcript_61661/g.182175  ORF Transcript_61661/g.182175 Transcript_61661/m.182175 type:complete len:135 (+) Transcript_61661:285-689(+)
MTARVVVGGEGGVGYIHDNGEARLKGAVAERGDEIIGRAEVWGELQELLWRCRGVGCRRRWRWRGGVVGSSAPPASSGSCAQNRRRGASSPAASSCWHPDRPDSNSMRNMVLGQVVAGAVSLAFAYILEDNMSV